MCLPNKTGFGLVAAAQKKLPGVRNAIFALSARGSSPAGFEIPDGLREALSRPMGAALYGLEAQHRAIKEQVLKVVAVLDGRMNVHSRLYALRMRLAALSALRFLRIVAPRPAPLFPPRCAFRIFCAQGALNPKKRAERGRMFVFCEQFSGEF